MQLNRIIQEVSLEVIAKEIEEKMKQFSYVIMKNGNNINNESNICR